MQFTTTTLAVVLAALAASPEVVAGPSLEGRANSLCNKQNYGAVGYPWQSSSTPGSFCGSNKPSNSGAWAQIPVWDGGDTVKCSGSGRRSLKVCNGGNPKASLPSTCNPPHNFPSSWTKGGSSVTISCKPATCSWATWWNCYLPTAWRQTCTIVTTKPGTSTSAAASSTQTVSSAAASSAAASSAAAAASSAAASSVDPNAGASSSAAASSAAGTPTSSSAPAATSTAAVDPTSYPVCQGAYQTTYSNYTLVAPNGYWSGLTVGAATQDASYMTYTLATSVSDCLAACDQIEGCVFVNTYYDENDTETDLPKHTPGVLTCAMFSTCVGTDKNNNWGGQDDPNIIVDSNGYCKSGACSS